MLGTLFLICAVVGGALVVAQLLLSVLAFGAGRGLRLHHRIGGSVGAARGGMNRGGMSRTGAHRGLFKALHHHPGGARGGPRGGVRAAGVAKQTIKTGAAPKAAAGAVSGHHWAATLLLGMLNFQGVVAGMTVFGLVGLAANAAKRPGSVALELGIVGALVMMALISGMLSMMTGLEKDGTVDLQQAVGKLASVYLSIPAKNEGKGKITVSLQQRFMEFSAVTFQDDLLPTGQKVVIVAVLEPATMLVVSADKYVPEAQA